MKNRFRLQIVSICVVASVTTVTGLTQAGSGVAEFSWMPQVTEFDWTYVVLHHSGTESGSVESIHTEHKSRLDGRGKPWLGIGYHFVIGNGKGMPDGSVQPTFRWQQQIHGAHSGNALINTQGIGICLIGHFEHHKPTGRQLQALKDLIRQLGSRYGISAAQVIGHSAVRATACPGKYFPLSEVQNVLQSSEQG